MLNNEEEKKKEGLLGALAGLFRGGAAGGGASGLGSSAAGAGGLFASKAGVLGMVLGGATIAAGIGVVYNFMGPSSSPVYSPSLFQDTYQEEQAAAASMERRKANSRAPADPSTLDMFREQAIRDGMSMEGEEGGSGTGAEGDGPGGAEGGGASASAEVEPPAPGYGAEPGAGPGRGKLASSLGFGQSGGGAGTAIPKMQTSGGLSGGIGQQFAPVYKAPVSQGKVSDMKGAMASRVTNSPKYTVPNFNKKGAFGQAKYAGKMGAKAAYSASDAGARTAATEAFAGETSGGGKDAGSPQTGVGLGGAGLSSGDGLKANDPNLNSNNSEPPPVPEPENVSPWEQYTDMAMNSMLWAFGLILVTKILGKIAKGSGPFAVIAYYAAVCTALAAIAFALKVAYAGYVLMSRFGQKWMGGMYIAMGVMLAIAAWEALCGLEKGGSVDKLPEGVKDPGVGKSVTHQGTTYTGLEKGGYHTVSKPMSGYSLTDGKGLGSIFGLGK